MLFSKSVLLTILSALSAQALTLPKIGDVVEVFPEVVSELKEGMSQLSNDVQENLEGLKQDVGETLKNVGATITKFEQLLLKSPQAPLLKAHREGEAIDHKYIVVFKSGVDASLADFHRQFIAEKQAHFESKLEEGHGFFAKAEGVSDIFSVSDAMTGYVGSFLPEVVELIRRDPSVAFVEEDSVVYANDFAIQKGAPWGLARISHRQPLSLLLFNQYLHDTEGGRGVTLYVIDTGIFVKHKQFEGRAKWGKTVPEGDEDDDNNGHGTHCAGTIASKDYGVAKHANVVAVKVLRLNGSGSMSDVIKGVEFAVQLHKADVQLKKKGFRGSTANMSLGGGKSPALDLAVNAAVRAGVHFAVAAGNENQDASETSPASAELPVTVGASTISDARAYFSNYGEAVDIFAPGLNIVSTYIGSETATATLSGTSMASPHIAGLLSYFVSLQPGVESEFFTAANGVTPAQLKKDLVHFATADKLTDVPLGTVNLLAFNGAGHNLTSFWGASDVSPPVGLL